MTLAKIERMVQIGGLVLGNTTSQGEKTKNKGRKVKIPADNHFQVLSLAPSSSSVGFGRSSCTSSIFAPYPHAIKYVVCTTMNAS